MRRLPTRAERLRSEIEQLEARYDSGAMSRSIHEVLKRLLDGKLNELNVPKDCRRRASAYGRGACVRRSRARKSASKKLL